MHWIHPVRAVQALFALIVLGLTAYIVSLSNSSSTVNFLLFLACWTLLLALPYVALAPIWFPRISNLVIITAVEALTMLFWFAGFIALGAQLPPPSKCHGHRCRTLQAATVFGSFEWALFAVTTAVTFFELRGSRSATSAKTTVRTSAHLGV